jgi:hypothetical protein
MTNLLLYTYQWWSHLIVETVSSGKVVLEASYGFIKFNKEFDLCSLLSDYTNEKCALAEGDHEITTKCKWTLTLFDYSFFCLSMNSFNPGWHSSSSSQSQSPRLQPRRQVVDVRWSSFHAEIEVICMPILAEINCIAHFISLNTYTFIIELNIFMDAILA